MGHIRTPKFELQLELADESAVEIIGVNSIKEANTEIIKNLHRTDLSGNVFLWGNNASGNNFIYNKGCDFLKLNQETKKFEPAFCS